MFNYLYYRDGTQGSHGAVEYFSSPVVVALRIEVVMKLLGASPTFLISQH